MARSEEIVDFKRRISSLIINNETLVGLINQSGITIENSSDLIGNNIFTFDRIPDTEEETTTYITIKVDILRINSINNLFKDIMITLRLVTHQNTIRLSGSITNKLDHMSIELDKMLNGNTDFGIEELKLTSNYEDKVDPLHPCRVIRFLSDGFNKGCS